MLLRNLFSSRLRRVSAVASTTVMTLVAFAATNAALAQKAEQMIARAPSQADVDVDNLADGEIADCSVERFDERGMTCFGLYKPDGKTLIRAWGVKKENNRTVVDQFRYYKNGVEVFRDVSGKEARWLNTGGSRRAALASDKKTIAAWIALSPQEATQEMVAALRTNDFPRYQRVALSEKELAGLNLSGAVGAEIQRQVKSVDANAFAKLAQTLAIPENATWGALNAGQPATVPVSDTIGHELDVYYNAAVVVMVGSGENAQSQELYVGDIVRVGDVWKIVGLPTGEPFGKATGAVSASSVFIQTSGDSAVAEGSADVGELGSALSEAYRKLESATPENYPELCDQTVKILVNIADANPQERDNMLSQAIDVVFSGVQSGVYPGGAKKLAEMVEAFADASPEVKARARQRQITAEYYVVSQKPSPSARELTKAQEKYSEDLAAFVEEYSTTAAAAEAAMTLALDQEYMLENETAVKYYQQVVQNAGNTQLGKKAAGAIARLQAEGGKLQLPAAQYFGGGAVDLEDLKGKPTIIFAWGSWDDASVDAVKKVAAQVNVVGVCVDSAPDPAAANAYFQQIAKTTPWKNVCDPAGLDGAFATALGIQTAPWIILIDKDGKVVRSNITNLEELPDVLNEMK